jgi:hypothetical protein
MLKKLAHLFILCSLFGGEAFGQPFTSNLPIVVIRSRPGPTPIDSAWFDIKADMGIIDNGPGKRNSSTDVPNNFNGPISIRVQGSSSIMWPKRSYRINTLNMGEVPDDYSLLGMPPHEDWVLKASYQDKTFLRDALAFRLYNQMGHYSSRIRFFELVIDGDYRGMYQLEEKIRRNDYRVNISKMTPYDNSGDALTGGYIVSLDKFTSLDPGWYSKYNSSLNKDSANFFLYYYPKPDSITQPQKDYIKTYFDKFEDALNSPDFANRTSGYRRFIDVTSFMDYFIVNELSRNVDGYRASTFFAKDRESLGGKIKALPLWDFNIAFGNCDYNNASFAEGWQHELPTNINFVPWWWWKFLQDPTFRDELQCRYRGLRKTLLSEGQIFQFIDQTATVLEEAQQRNFAKWPIMSQVVWPQPAPAPGSYAAEIGRLKSFIQQRLAWMDKNMYGNTCVMNEEDTLSGELISSAYPNPFEKDVVLSYQIKKKCQVLVQLFDVAGNPVMTVKDKEMNEGIYLEQPTTSQLPAGTYILRIQAGDDITYGKLIKLNN